MPNALTRVPDRPVPELPPAIRALLPIADLFMVLMVSRPASGTLGDTWVTPATLWLSLASAALLLAAAMLLASRGTAGAIAAAAALILLALGCLAVVAVAAAQRAARTR